MERSITMSSDILYRIATSNSTAGILLQKLFVRLGVLKPVRVRADR
ncbi:MAG TPA: hypothetical protein IAB84_03650 [Candidatus Choladousia intestinigallinarum]|nr:hypothetical protein [Candidatus Choladousia intestinigallinarum]